MTTSSGLSAFRRFNCSLETLCTTSKVTKLERGPAGFELRVVTTTAHDHFLDLQVTSEEKLCVFLSCCPGRIPRGTPSTLEVSCEKNSGCHCRVSLETEGWKPRQRAGSVNVTDQTDFAQSFYEPAWKLRPFQDTSRVCALLWKDVSSERKVTQSLDNKDALPGLSAPPGPQLLSSSCMCGHWTTLLSWLPSRQGLFPTSSSAETPSREKLFKTSQGSR